MEGPAQLTGDSDAGLRSKRVGLGAAVASLEESVSLNESDGFQLDTRGLSDSGDRSR